MYFSDHKSQIERAMMLYKFSYKINKKLQIYPIVRLMTVITIIENLKTVFA